MHKVPLSHKLLQYICGTVCALRVGCTVLCSYQTGGTVDEVEAQKFRDVCWWDPRGPMAALHSMNMLRVPLIKNSLLGLPPDDVTTLDQVPHPLQGCSVLDSGCGAGLLCEVYPSQKLYYPRLTLPSSHSHWDVLVLRLLA